MNRFCPIALTGLLLAGCAGGGQHPAPTTQQNPPAAQPPSTFQSPKGNFSVSVPGGWNKTANQDEDVLHLGKDKASIAVIVPNLPPHLPGFIPIGGVTDGYINDLKKTHADLKVEENASLTIPDAHARRVVSTMTRDGGKWYNAALLVVHGDHVYIISTDAPDAAYPDARKAFDAMAASLKWTTS